MQFLYILDTFACICFVSEKNDLTLQFKINEFGDLELMEESSPKKEKEKNTSQESVNSSGVNGEKQIGKGISVLKVKKMEKKENALGKNRYSGKKTVD